MKVGILMLLNKEQSCADCRIYLADQKTCQIMQPMMQGQIEPTDYCTHHMSFAHKCDVCHRGILKPMFSPLGNDAYGTYCESCYRSIS